MKEHINILIASDTNYASFYGVMLTSLFESNKDSLFDVYFLTDKSLKEEDSEKFELLTSKYNAHLFVIPVNVDLVKTFPEVAHIKLPAYYHLCLSNLLPNSVHKIIYLDGDIIVNGSLRSLWDTDLSSFACAHVVNCTYFDDDYYTRLGYEKKWNYYNNGVAVYNVDYLRKIDFSNMAIRYINENKDKVYWMDQDAENALLYDKMLSIPITYNFQTLFFHHSDWDNYDLLFRRQIMDVASNPIIIHYCGHLKPWDFRYYLMPYGKIWRKVCKHSLWQEAYSKRPYSKYIKFWIKRIFFPLLLIKKRNAEYIVESKKYS